MSYYTTLEFIRQTFPNESFNTVNGFDSAVIGLDESSMRIIYSVSQCVHILTLDGMTEEEAFEYFEYNIMQSYLGENAPIWCDDYFQ